jgi:CRP-like cAMP-binding protein
MFRRTDPIPAPLRTSDLASALPARELRLVERRGTLVPFSAGRTAMREGEVGRECMLVVSGSFTVERDGEGIAVLQPGMIMGEIALLTQAPRNATVTSMEPSTVYAFNRREFISLLDECPVFSRIVQSGAQERSAAS